MIESIYSKEHAKGLKTEVHTMFRFPKNIRQIGQATGNRSIYAEDYVMTFIRQMSEKGDGKYQFAVLLGKYVRSESSKNIFIHGAVCVEEIEFEKEVIFSNEAWTNIYNDIKKYFTDAEIVGWFLAKPEVNLEPDEKITKVHLDNFAGQDKTLLMYDSSEKEEIFFIYEDGKLVRQKGYYIYYEKNEEMQNYMIDQKGTKGEELNYNDRATKAIRDIIASKKETPSEKKFIHLIYGASTAIAAAALIAGVSMLNNYIKMNNMEQTLNTISKNLNNQNEIKENTQTATPFGKKQVTEVEEMDGNVTTINQDSFIEEELKKAAKKASAKAVQMEKKSQKAPVASKAVQCYIVKKGDTLASISYDLYKSIYHVDKIQKANGIEDKDVIYVGQKLIIP